MERTTKKLLELIRNNEDKAEIKTEIKIRKQCLSESIKNTVETDSFYELPNIDFFEVIEKGNIREASMFKMLVEKTREVKGTSSIYLLGFLDLKYLTKEEIIDLIKSFKMRELYQKAEVESHLLERSYKDECEHLKKEVEELKALTKSSIKKPDDFEPDLNKAIDNGKFESARYLIEGQKSKGISLLHYATKYYNFPCIKYIIENNLTSINTKDSYGQTPLHIAASCGYKGVVKYFVEECHADIEATDDKGRTPLSVAVINNQFETVKYLIEEHHANIKTENNYGCTLVQSAASAGCLNILKYLLNRGLSANQKDKNGASPLFFAANMGRLEVVKYLIETCHVDTKCTITSDNVTSDCYKYIMSHR